MEKSSKTNCFPNSVVGVSMATTPQLQYEHFTL